MLHPRLEVDGNPGISPGDLAKQPRTGEAERSEALTRSLLESAPDAMLIVNAEGMIQLTNAETERLFGYDRVELVGRPVELLVPDRFKDRHRGHHSKFLAAPRVRPMHAGFDLWGLRKDGSEVPVEISLSPLETDAGTFVVAAIRDITDRRRAEQELRDANARLLAASEGRYRQILETTPDGVWRVDENNVTDYVNGRMADILGYTECEMIGLPISRFMDPDWLSAAESDMVHNQQTRSAAVVDHCFRHKDGSVVWCRVSASPLFDSHDQLAGSIAVMSDITMARQREAELRLAERLLAAATDSMTEGMCALDREGRVTLMNRAAEQLLGWKEDELRGRVAHDVIHFQHEDGSPYPLQECPLTPARAAGKSISIDDDLFTQKGGELLPVAYTASPIVTEGIEGSVVVFRDISTQKLQEQRRARELDELSWVGRIRDALDEERFVLYAQPVINIATRAVIGHELLLRMVDANGAVIAPGRFLPAAERFDIVQEIDRWVAGQAINLAARGFPAAFNVSGRSLATPELIATIVKQLEATGADPSLLVCEITETALAQDASLAAAFVRQISALGCRVALDDFGTGYGGFIYLKQLQIDFIKIDIEFIRDLASNLENQHVVTAIVSLAKSFGQETIAEGVEEASALELLAELGVDHAQGYGIGRPQPCDQVFPGREPQLSTVATQNGRHTVTTWSRGRPLAQSRT